MSDAAHSSRPRVTAGRSLLAILVAAGLGAGTALAPTLYKGAGPRTAYENLQVARNYSAAGVFVAEDGEGTVLPPEQAAGGVPTTMGNGLTFRVYGWAMRAVPELTSRPELLAGLWGALAAAGAAVAALRLLGRPRFALVAGALAATLPAAWVAASSPAHLDLALALAAWSFAAAFPSRSGTTSLRSALIAGLLAGLAATAREAFVVVAPVAGLAVGLGGGAWRRSGVLVGVAAATYLAVLLAGGGSNLYLDREDRGVEFSPLGHAFPDFETYREYRDAPPGEELSQPLTRGRLDPRLAAIYAGRAPARTGGLAGELATRAAHSLPFYARWLVALETYGGPLVLAVALLGLLAAGATGAALRRALLGGLGVFLAFHVLVGTSNESHFAVLTVPVALALTAAAQRAGGAVRPARQGGLVLLVGAVLVAHATLCTQVSLSRLYQGAGRARYGVEDTLLLARRVAEAGEDEGAVLLGTRASDAYPVAWYSRRAVVYLRPDTLQLLAEQDRLEGLLQRHRVEILAGFPEEAAAAARAMDADLLVVPAPPPR